MERGFVSFFSGALGLDLGLEQAGLRPLLANEFDKPSISTIRANRPDLPLFDCDARSLSVEMVEERAKSVRGDIFAVVGGPPCQAFSTAGRRRGLADDRGNVFLHFLDLAVALRPEYIVIENVRGLLSSPLKHRPHSARGEGCAPLRNDEMPGGALRKILSVLDGAGYATTFELYNVANFGVPQTRERVVLLSARSGTPVPHLVPTHSRDGVDGTKPWRTFHGAVGDLTELGECAEFRKGRERFFKRLAPGENWRDLSDALQREALGKAYFSSGGRVGFCRRLALDRPSPTLVTSPTMPATELGHPTECRPLSVNEYKRLQTFPDDWIVCGSLSAQYRQIGNAIGQHLVSVSEGVFDTPKCARAKSRYRNTDEQSWRRLYA